MKKFSCFIIVFITLLSLILTGCNNNEYQESNTFLPLSNVVYPSKEKENVRISQDLVKAVNEMYFEIAEDLVVEKENFIFSPTSLYIALSMLTEGSVNETYEELMDFLNINSLEDLRTLNKGIYENNYYENKDGKLKLANSLWTRHGLNVGKEYIETLETSYYGEVYNVDFANSIDQENIRKWINKNTDNFLNINEDNYKIDSNLSALLINTLYFNNKWQDEFKEKNTYEDYFYNPNEELVKYMVHTIDSMYKRTNEYLAVSDYFKNGNRIVYVLPNEGINVYDLLEEDVTTYDGFNSCQATINVPKFKYQKAYNLNNILQDHGVNGVFGGGLDKINQSLYLSYIEQDVGIELSEEGVKAAAITSGGMCESAGPEEFINVKLNRPFIYYILDNQNVILFVGVINKPQFE